jgi:hypothetical protein
MHWLLRRAAPLRVQRCVHWLAVALVVCLTVTARNTRSIDLALLTVFRLGLVDFTPALIEKDHAK